ncbi:putative coat protein [Noggi virus]|nr:putative coat protein [Noggi virus]
MATVMLTRDSADPRIGCSPPPGAGMSHSEMPTPGNGSKATPPQAMKLGHAGPPGTDYEGGTVGQHGTDDKGGPTKATKLDKHVSSMCVISGDGYLPNVGCAANVVTGMPARVVRSNVSSRFAYTFSTVTTMRTTIHGKPEQVCTTNIYRINPRAKTAEMTVPDICSPYISLDTPIHPQYMSMVENIASRKVTIPRIEFKVGAVIERLAKALSKFAMWGRLSLKDLCKDEKARIRMLTNKTTSVIAPNELYIPADTYYSDMEIAAVIVYSASAAGATVVFDQIPVDDSGRPSIPKMVDAVLAIACYKALVYLGQLCDYNNQGTIWAYAFTRGIHSSATVVGHTDEGAYVREVLRRGAFEKPCGVLVYAPASSWSGIPVSIGNSISALQSVVMSTLLTTAAGVALADPTVLIGGVPMPQVITVDENQPLFDLTPGVTEVDDSMVQLVAARAVASCCYDFCRNYMYVLTKLFGFSLVEYNVAHHLQAAFGWYKSNEVVETLTDANGRSRTNTIQLVDRHLQRTGHYWYWIEPTGIIQTDFNEMPAVRIASGPRALPHKSSTVAALPDIQKTRECLGATGLILDFISARRTPAIDYLRESPDDGLAWWRVARIEPQAIACSGVDDSSANALASVLLTKPSISDLLWQRSDARINAPAELLVLGSPMACTLVHNEAALAAGRIVPTSLPSADELASWSITYLTSGVQYLGLHQLQNVPPKVRQQRGKAASAFKAAMRSYGHGSVDPTDWLTPTDEAYMTALIIQDIVSDSLTNEVVSASAALGFIETAILDSYTKSTKQFTEPLPGSIAVDKTVKDDPKAIQNVAHNDPAAEMRVKLDAEPLTPALHRTIPSELQGLSTSEHEPFVPTRMDGSTRSVHCWTANAKKTNALGKPAWVLLPCEQDRTDKAVGFARGANRLVYGTYKTQMLEQPDKSVKCVRTVTEKDASVHEVDELLHVIEIQPEQAFEYYVQLGDGRHDSCYCNVVNRKLPRVTADEIVIEEDVSEEVVQPEVYNIENEEEQ